MAGPRSSAAAGRERRGRLAFAVASLALAAPLAAGFLGALHPALDSASHFRAHLAAAAAVVALAGLFAAARSVRRMAAALLLLSAAAGATAVPFLAALDRPAVADSTLSLLQMNLLHSADTDAAIERIATLRPDFVTLQEMRPDFFAALAARGVVYPHVARCARRDAFSGVAILSRHPFVDGSGLCEPQRRFVARQVRVGENVVTLVNHHLAWPWPFGQWRDVAALAPVYAALPAPLVVAGDFNAAPWSAAVRRIAGAANARIVRGVGPTFMPAGAPARLRRIAGLPIDHVLVSPGIRVSAASRPAATRSDHLPVLVRFSPAPAREG